MVEECLHGLIYNVRSHVVSPVTCEQQSDTRASVRSNSVNRVVILTLFDQAQVRRQVLLHQTMKSKLVMMLAVSRAH